MTGPGAGQFEVTAWPASSIIPAGESRFAKSYSPLAGGETATATVTISNTDGNSNPYTFVIEGHGGMRHVYLPVVPIKN